MSVTNFKKIGPHSIIEYHRLDKNMVSMFHTPEIWMYSLEPGPFRLQPKSTSEMLIWSSLRLHVIEISALLSYFRSVFRFLSVVCLRFAHVLNNIVGGIS